MSERERCPGSHPQLLLHNCMGCLAQCDQVTGFEETEDFDAICNSMVKEIIKCQLACSVITVYQLSRFGRNKVALVSMLVFLLIILIKFKKDLNP